MGPQSRELPNSEKPATDSDAMLYQTGHGLQAVQLLPLQDMGAV